MTTNEYTRFYINDINPDFGRMGVTREEFAWTNGEESLLKDGVLYSRCSSEVCDDLGISKDDQIMIVYEIPHFWNKEDPLLEDNAQGFVQDHLYRSYGILSEDHQVVFLTESDYESLQNESRFLLRTPSLH